MSSAATTPFDQLTDPAERARRWAEMCRADEAKREAARELAAALTPAQSGALTALMDAEPAKPSRRWAQLVNLGLAHTTEGGVELTTKGVDVANSPRHQPSRAARRRSLRQQGWRPCGECRTLVAPGTCRCPHCGC